MPVLKIFFPVALVLLAASGFSFEIGRRVDQKEPLKSSAAQAAATIDAIILKGLQQAKQNPNPPSTDEQFLRRVFLDIVGRIPTGTETEAFLADKSADKRSRLIDNLLASDGYNSHLFNYFADMLRIKDSVGKQGQTYVYQEWLKDQIAKDRPWSETVYQMMTAKGRLAESGPAGYLLRDPGMPLDNLANTLTVFLAANVACAQCHDHPSASWTQRDFYEMAAFFGGIETHSFKAQRMMNKIIKSSDAFDQNDKRFLRQFLEVNAAEVKEEPGKKLKFPEDYKYKDARPGEVVKPQLIRWSSEDKFNPSYAIDTSKPEKLREEFAKWMTSEHNPRFAATIANRLWKRAFGIAASEPVTDLDDLTRVANIDLLNALASEMKRVKFSLKEFQRIIFNTQAYQRQASATPDLAAGDYRFPGPVLRRMTAEQVWDSVLALAAGEQIDHYKLRRADDLKKFVIPEREITPKVAEEAAIRLRKQGVRPIRVKENLQMEGGGKPPPQIRGFTIARASELEQPTRESHFLRMFGQSDRTTADDSSVEGGVPQVLMQMNGDVQDVIGSQESLAMRHASAKKTPAEQIEALYISFLGRKPTPAQLSTLQNAMAKGMTLSEVSWVLFNSREFLFVQ
ncbi:MAG TPA: DUF1549 domain-containing protein [Planctomycetota bacterium]|nr:DUF1549 domain-containing protein [Planctomycetota bacterium]